MKGTHWISICAVLAAVTAVHATYNQRRKVYTTLVCDCNGRSRYCLPDSVGLHCVDCQGNTEGRHCELCKTGYYLQGAEESCTACKCNATGSAKPSCDSRGRCSCKEGVTGEKCDRCPDGPIGPNGCKQSRRVREDPHSASLPCFCYGHSSLCSSKPGYSVHKITSNFAEDPEGWTTATAQGVTPDNVHFRWSPKHQDLEVISKNSLPVYLYAPAKFLGNQQLSYGQNFSFSLRLDRGVRHPSTNDVIMEGGGLRVSASLGDLRSIVPCGQKINYSFKLDEQASSKWRPQLSSQHFHKLLQDLTAIKIRATFGENGRGYLDNVVLVSARRGEGVPASWVQTCSCPAGYEGDFCDRCSTGFKRKEPESGPFSVCVACDPQTTDCYPNDETTTCPKGFYPDPWLPRACVKCPCAEGATCSIAAGALQPRCEQLCPSGAMGSRCDVCQEGFYGDPLSGRACRPCSCNGHIDADVAGSCDKLTGECLKCLNNREGRDCEDCKPGFYQSRGDEDTCKPCDCDVVGSASSQCNSLGDCRCRLGFEGLKCQRSNCPACFGPIKAKLDAYAAKLKQLESLLSGGGKPTDNAKLEAALREAEQLVDALQDDTSQLNGLEKGLQERLSLVSRSLSKMEDGQDLQKLRDTAAEIKDKQRTYNGKVELVQDLIVDMKSDLDKAKTDLKKAELPQGDAPVDSSVLPALAKTATGLADKHVATADVVKENANAALSNSEKALALVKSLTGKEHKVKGLIGDLKTMYDKNSGLVKGLENKSTQLIGEAKDESKRADDMLKNLAGMEKNIPTDMKGEVDAMVSKLDKLKVKGDADIKGFRDLQDGVERNLAATGDLLEEGAAAKKKFGDLSKRVDVAKDMTEGALNSANGNIKGLDDALNNLRGFDKQIADGKKLADAAINRLPAIKATIKQAVDSNGKTQTILDGVTDAHTDVMQKVDTVEGKVDELENAIDSLPAHDTLLRDATKLNVDATALKANAGKTADDLKRELEAARKLQADAEQAAIGATGAFNNAKDTKDAVGESLRRVNNMLANLNNTEPVDETRLKKLEDSVGEAAINVVNNLQPRLKEAMDKEAAHRRKLTGINGDIDMILKDIDNLEEILRKIPIECLNTAPQEEA